MTSPDKAIEEDGDSCVIIVSPPEQPMPIILDRDLLNTVVEGTPSHSRSLCELPAFKKADDAVMAARNKIIFESAAKADSNSIRKELDLDR